MMSSLEILRRLSDSGFLLPDEKPTGITIIEDAENGLLLLDPTNDLVAFSNATPELGSIDIADPNGYASHIHFRQSPDHALEFSVCEDDPDYEFRCEWSLFFRETPELAIEFFSLITGQTQTNHQPVLNHGFSAGGA